MPRGFTLLEILLVMALIGLLASVSYPLYTHHLLGVRRHHAHIILWTIALHMETYYNAHNSYEGASLTALPTSTEIDHYQLRLQVTDSQHYRLQAIPIGTQTKDPCGTLELTERGPELSPASSTECG